MPRQKKRTGDFLGCSLLQPLWDRHWGGPGRWCFRPPALGGWRGDWLVWGPQQTWWMPCRPLQAWFFVGRERLRRKNTFPVCWHRGAHFVVPPLAAMAHSSMYVCVCVRACVRVGGCDCECECGVALCCALTRPPGNQKTLRGGSMLCKSHTQTQTHTHTQTHKQKHKHRYKHSLTHTHTHIHTIDARRTGVTNKALHWLLTNLVRP